MEIKSELVMCPQGHYYNAAVHASCPICGGSGGASGGMGSFAHTEAPGGGAIAGGMGGFAHTEAPGAAPIGGGMGSFSHTEAPGAVPGGGAGGFAPTEPPSGGGWGGAPIGATQPSDNAPSGPVNPFSVQTTIGGDLAPSGQLNPVVGWLVCIDGPARGTDWRIHAGYNYIGREVGDIHIQGDNQISREKHALVAFYAKTLTYFVGPAEGRNIVELNGAPVFNTVALKNYDVITVGATSLMFVGLCGEHFSWSGERSHA